MPWFDQVFEEPLYCIFFASIRNVHRFNNLLLVAVSLHDAGSILDKLSLLAEANIDFDDLLAEL